MGDGRMSIPPTFPGGPAQARLRPEATDATRYLCAAAHLDEAFARAVLDEVLHQPHRAIAPSHGISLGPVIRHCLAARRRSLIRDGLVAAILILGLIASFTAGVAVVVTLLLLWLIMRALRLWAGRRAGASLAFLVAALVLVPLLIAGILGSFGALTYWLYGLSSYGFPEEGGYPEAGGAPLRASIWVVLLLMIWGTCFAYRLIVHRTIAVEFTSESYDPRRAPALDRVHERHLDYIEQAQRGNVTVYSQENGRPFIGFGAVTEQWCLVTPLRSAASSAQQIDPYADGYRKTTNSVAVLNDAEAVPFTIDQLYEAIRTGMAELADPRLPEDEVVPHLSVRDRVFVSGKLPINSPFLDQGQPRYRLSEPEIKDVQRTVRGRLRHYQSVRMAAWGGELEVTTFLHATQRGRMLYVEFIATVVPSIRSAYHRIDTYDRLDAAATVRAAGRAVGDVIRSPLALVAVTAAGIAKIRRALNESSDAKRISRQLMFDYGCRTSVRELAADFANPAPFQPYDANERVSVIERRLLQILVGFLEEHGYDITDLAGQVATVINNSTNINSNTVNNSNLVTGSTFNNSPVVAGNSASANVNAGTKSPAPSPAAGRAT